MMRVMTNEDDIGTRGFAQGTDRYDRARPGYSVEALDRLCSQAGIGEGTRVLDLAAGTGKLTRCLVERGAEVVAVEPSAAMRGTFARVTPGVEVHEGTAERIPMPAAAFDVVTVAQAFHWFDVEPAMREIARVLRPGGVLALVWNERDEQDEFVERLHHLARWPFRIFHDWREELDKDPAFDPAERTVLTWRDELTHDQVVERISTFSYISAMDKGPREELLARVRDMVVAAPEPVDLAYVTDIYVTRRRDRQT